MTLLSPAALMAQPGELQSTPRARPGAPVSSSPPGEAQAARIAWSQAAQQTLIAAPAQPSGGRPSVDMSRVAKMVSQSTQAAISDLPLIAPVVQAVTRQAQLSAEGEAPEASGAASAPATAPAAAGAEGKPIDLDQLATELAGRIQGRLQRELERRGGW